MKLKTSSTILISLFIIFYMRTATSVPVRTYASETNWDDHYANKKMTIESEPTIFESAWEDSVASISNGWEQFKAGFEEVKESVGSFFSGAPKKVGGAIGTGLGEMVSGLVETLLGGTFIAIKFVITVVIIVGFMWFMYLQIKKHCCVT